MTDGVGLLLNVMFRLVGRTVLGAPSVGRRTTRVSRATPPPRLPLRRSTGGVLFRAPTSPHLVGAAFHARPARVDGQRRYTPPTLHQPLSHGAKRRDSSPFRGAEGWEEVCGVSASAYRDADTYCHDADTYVSLMPVRGGVLDAPWSCDHRADLYAPVRRAQFYPCLPRRARLASTAQRIISRGHSPRTIFTGVRGRP